MTDLDTTQAVNALLYLTQEQLYGKNTWPYPFDSIDEPTLSDKSFIIMGTSIIQMTNLLSHANEQNVRIVMMNLNLYSEDDTNISNTGFSYNTDNSVLTYTGTTPINKISIAPKEWYIYYKEDVSNVWIINHNLKLSNGNPSGLEFYSKEKLLTTPSYTTKVIDNDTLQITFDSEVKMNGYVLIKS